MAYLFRLAVAMTIERPVFTNFNERVIITPAVLEKRDVLIRRMNSGTRRQGPLNLPRLRVHESYLPIQCDHKRAATRTASNFRIRPKTNSEQQNESRKEKIQQVKVIESSRQCLRCRRQKRAEELKSAGVWIGKGGLRI